LEEERKLTNYFWRTEVKGTNRGKRVVEVDGGVIQFGALKRVLETKNIFEANKMGGKDINYPTTEELGG